MRAAIVWMLVLLAGPSQAAPPPTHAHGADLAAWAVLEQRAPSADAYRSFILAWADSPLAEAAWERLVALGAASTEADTSADRQTLQRVRAQWMERQRALARATRQPGPVLDLDAPVGATAMVPID